MIMASITYMPLRDDPETTIVDGIIFTAYVPVEVPDSRPALIDKLSINPWFTAGTPDHDRRAEWLSVHDPKVMELEELEHAVHAAIVAS
jgi:hypothetical protein